MEYDEEVRIRKHLIITSKLVTITLLIISLFNLPNVYYTILRFVVTGEAIYLLNGYYYDKKIFETWVFALIALLFNPLFPVSLHREVWQAMDIVASIMFLISVFMKPPLNGY